MVVLEFATGTIRTKHLWLGLHQNICMRAMHAIRWNDARKLKEESFVISELCYFLEFKKNTSSVKQGDPIEDLEAKVGDGGAVVEVEFQVEGQDLDLTKPGVHKPPKRDEFTTTTKKVLSRADFRDSTMSE
ncbi:hypothetical protein JHK87_039750 [Glycine soja]|nr:hypothetical protein JHK87_039750 [Glycine soja]